MLKMKILSWNMARAIRPTGLNTDPWAVLEEINPDIALLQEVRVPPMTFGGHFHIVPTARGWGTGVWSKYPFSWTGTLPRGSDSSHEAIGDALAGYVATAAVELSPGRSLSVTSVHAYPAPVDARFLAGFSIDSVKCPAAAGVWPGDLVWWATRSLPNAGDPIVLGGDWNTALRFDEVYGPRGNAEFFARMSETGWCDAMKKFHDAEVQTYFSTGRGPYQLDHVFLTSDLFNSLQGADVAATPQVLGASDHAPIVLEILE
jgi:exonuclease III